MPFPDLPPTIVWPVVAGTSKLRVEGLVESQGGLVAALAFLQVQSDSDAAFPSPATIVFEVVRGSAMTVDVGLIGAGDFLRARLTDVVDNGPWSPPVEVRPMNQADALGARPRPTWAIHPDQSRIIVSGAPPGYEVLVEQVSGPSVTVLGQAFAGPAGIARVRVSTINPDPLATIIARVRVGAASGAPSTFPVAPVGFEVPTPTIEPLFEGQGQVVVKDCIPGARVALTQTRTLLGAPPATRYGVAGPSGVVKLRPPFSDLIPGYDTLTAQSILPASALSAEVEVLDPVLCSGTANERQHPDLPWPRIRGPLNSGDSHIWLDRWVPGVDVSLHMFFAGSGFDRNLPPPRIGAAVPPPSLILGPRPMGGSGRIALPFPIGPAAPPQALWVQAVQVVGGVERRSQPQRVESLEWWGLTAVPTPRMLGPVLEGAIAIRVARVVPGADVYVERNGSFAGYARADYGGSVEVPVMTLNAGDMLTAFQVVGTNTGGVEIIDAETVQADAGVAQPPPRVMEPVLENDRRVWVSGISPGSQVLIADDAGNPIGEGAAAETIDRATLWRPVPEGRSIKALSRRVTETGPSAAVTSWPPLIADEGIEIREVEFGIANPVDLGDFNNNGVRELLLGKVYYRTTPAPSRGVPLVFVAHGVLPNSVVSTTGVKAFEEVDPCVEKAGFSSLRSEDAISYLEYDRLCRNLARNDCIVVSFAYDPSIASVGSGTVPRAELFEEAIRMIRSDATLVDPQLGPDLLQVSPVFLVGHSAGGDGVLIAAGRQAVPISGVVAVAPASNGVALQPVPQTVNVPVLVLFGSQDYFIPSGDTWIQSWTWVPYLADGCTWVYAHGATHQTWNTQWSRRLLAGMLTGGLPFYEPLTVGGEDTEYETLLTVMATALIRWLTGRSELEAFIRAELLPEQAETLPAFVDWIPSKDDLLSQVVVDDFDDPDPLTNALGGTVSFVGTAATEVEIAAAPPGQRTGVFVSTGRSVYVDWNVSAAAYRTSWTPVAAPPGLPRIALRVASTSDPSAPPQDLAAAGRDVLVELAGGGITASIRLGAIRPAAALPEFLVIPADPIVTPVDSTTLWAPYTVILPLDGFQTADGLRIEAALLESVRLELEVMWPSGRMVFDDIRLVGDS